MQRQHERTLEILTAIGDGAPVTQRALAAQLGVALGLANLCLKRLASKGLIKMMEFPAKPSARKRLHYVLTPKGAAEKARLSYEYMAYSMRLLARTRGNLRETMARLHAAGTKRFALCGVGAAAALAYLTLREFGLEPIGVFDHTAGGRVLGFPVRPLEELAAEEVDGGIVATFDRPEQRVVELGALRIPAGKCLPPRRLGRPG